MADNEENKDGMQFVRGFPMPDVPWFKKEIIESVYDYIPRDGDVILACYPKTGSTWLQYIVMQILSKGESFPSIEDTISKEAPIMELVGAEVLDTLKEPRVYKHHIAYNMMQKNDKAKIVYIYRNPEDTFVSYYHFMQNFEELPPWSFDLYFENFLTGYTTFGSYFKNVSSFFDHKKSKNLLLVSYEKLKLDTKREILRIANFLGESYYQVLSNSEEILSKILEQTSFDYMKKNLVFLHPAELYKSSPSRNLRFFRKGTIGDGKNALTSDQLDRMKKVAVEILKNHPEVLEEWYGKDI